MCVCVSLPFNTYLSADNFLGMMMITALLYCTVLPVVTRLYVPKLLFCLVLCKKNLYTRLMAYHYYYRFAIILPVVRIRIS